MNHKIKSQSTSHLSWYHCGRCGSLFQAALTPSKTLRCTECGLNPIPFKAENNSQQKPFFQKNDNQKFTEKKIKEKNWQNIIHENIEFFKSAIVLFWLIFTFLIIFIAKNFYGTSSKKVAINYSNKAKSSEIGENFILNKNLNSCVQVMANFLQAGPPEQRSQYVINRTKSVKLMGHEDIENSSTIEAPAPGIAKSSLVNLGDEKAIETSWTIADDRIIEAIFRKERNEWLIDWEHFVRYSDMPFSVFLSGNGDAEGEFRLLARERLADERKNMSTISLMFYAPIFGLPADTASPSPEFLVDRNSPEGQLLKAAFSALKNKKRPFDAKLANHDPEGMIRVRVKIRRSGEVDTRAFKITELKACHWYSSDLPGFDLNPDSNTIN